jgi:hypothetical protein
VAGDSDIQFYCCGGMRLSIHLPSVIRSTCCIVAVGGVTDVKLPDAPRHIPSRPEAACCRYKPRRSIVTKVGTTRVRVGFLPTL